MSTSQPNPDIDPAPPAAASPGGQGGLLNPLERLFLIAETLALYVHVRRLARSKPLPETLKIIRSRASGVRRVPVITDDPYRLSFIVQRVLRKLPTDTRCLMQTVTLLAMLASRGDDGVVVISTQTGGEFAAHAWLEQGGRALLPPSPPEFRLVEL